MIYLRMVKILGSVASIDKQLDNRDPRRRHKKAWHSFV
jgi:hypothetical protein